MKDLQQNLLDKCDMGGIIIFTFSLREMDMAARRPIDSKTKALLKEGTLNPHPESVRDELFVENEFFDPRDLLQVKYEMLRQVQIENQSIQQATDTFGFSRPSFYSVQRAFEQKGMAGLFPQQRGPQGAHKLTDDIMESIEQFVQEEPTLRAPALAQRLREQFGLSVHPRSIERALAKRKKKR